MLQSLCVGCSIESNSPFCLLPSCQVLAPVVVLHCLCFSGHGARDPLQTCEYSRQLRFPKARSAWQVVGPGAERAWRCIRQWQRHHHLASSPGVSLAAACALPTDIRQQQPLVLRLPESCRKRDHDLVGRRPHAALMGYRGVERLQRGVRGRDALPRRFLRRAEHS